MEKGCNIEQFNFRQLVDNPVGDRKLFAGIVVSKLPAVLNNLHGMCINGIDMKQVVLHLAYNAAKGGEVAS